MKKKKVKLLWTIIVIIASLSLLITSFIPAISVLLGG